MKKIEDVQIKEFTVKAVPADGEYLAEVYKDNKLVAVGSCGDENDFNEYVEYCRLVLKETK